MPRFSELRCPSISSSARIFHPFILSPPLSRFHGYNRTYQSAAFIRLLRCNLLRQKLSTDRPRSPMLCKSLNIPCQGSCQMSFSILLYSRQGIPRLSGGGPPSRFTSEFHYTTLTMT